MSKLTLRAAAVLVSLATSGATLLASTPPAAAVTALDTAVSELGLVNPRTTTLPASGDITGAFVAAARSAGTSTEAHVVYLPGSVTVSATVRAANHVYIVAEPGARITWRGSDPNFLRFAPASGASMTSGVHGGTWNGANRAKTTVISVSDATVNLVALTVIDADKHGIAAYDHSSLTLRNVSTTSNDFHGVYVEDSILNASGVRANRNRQNGIQLSRASSGTITGSWIDDNGQGVRGSTTGKIGHGLGVAYAATVTVSGTRISGNKVCGVSLSGKARATISGSHIDGNGRHGLGTTAGTTATISDSWVNDNGYHGVLASGKGTHVTLNRVSISRAARSGVSVPTRGKLTLVSGNTIDGNRSHGVTVSGSGSIRISGEANLVTGNKGDGLRLTGSGTRGRIEAAVTFRNNRHSAIVVSRAKLAMVTCVYSGNKKKIETRARGKVTTLS